MFADFKHQNNTSVNAKKNSNLSTPSSIWGKSNTFASAINGNSNQWPSLQSKQSSYQKNTNTVAQDNNTDNLGAESCCTEDKGKFNTANNLNLSAKGPQPKSLSWATNQNITKNNSFPIEKSVNKTAKEKDDGWITVGNKANKKEIKLKETVEQPTNEQLLAPGIKDDIPETEKEKEEKLRVSKERKQKIKEEKKMKRELKARELAEKSRRDTKVNLISQDMIDSYINKNNPNPQSNLPNYHNQFLESPSEYPSLGGHSLHSRRVKNVPPIPWITTKNVWPTPWLTNKNAPPTPWITNKNAPPTSSLQIDGPSPVIPATSSQSNHVNKSSIWENSEVKINESPVKKKVRSKDLVNVDIMDLIKEKKMVAKSKTSHFPTIKETKVEKPEFRGKIFEGKKKKLTTLKKNLLNEKNRQKQLLLTACNGQMSQSNGASSPESSSSDTSQPRKSLNTVNIENLEERNESEIMKKEEDPTHLAKTETTDLKCYEVNSAKELKIEENLDSQIKYAQVCQELKREVELLMNPIHSSKFREYCNHVTSPMIDKAIKDVLQPLVMFQRRLYLQEPGKAKMKRRYCCGLKETTKLLACNRIKCVILVPNLKPSPGEGCMDQLVYKVVNRATESGVPVVFGLGRTILAKLCGIKGYSSCIALLNIQGVQDKYETLMELVQDAKHQYERLVSKVNLEPGGLIKNGSKSDGEVLLEAS